MKNLAQYLKLWQKKRDELRVDTDAGSDWLDMSKLLDKHMPVNNDSGGSAPKKGISLFTTLLITLSAAAMFYVGHRVIETKKKTAYQKHQLHHKKHGISSGIDSLAVADSLQQSENQIADNDSTSAEQNTIVGKATSDNGTTKNNAKSLAKTDSVNSKNIAEQSNSNNKKATNTQNSKASAELSDNKKLNSTNAGNKRISNSSTKGQSADLSSNSSLLNNSNSAKKLNFTGSRDNKKNNKLTNSSDKNSLTLAGKNNQFNNNNLNNNSFYTETNLNPTNRNQSYNRDNQTLLTLPDGKSIGVNAVLVNTYPTLNSKSLFQTGASASSKSTKNKVKSPLHIYGTFDWGVLIGANSSGSFTSGSLNKNGSLPVDIFPGIYGTYNLNAKWGIGAQVSVLSPQIAKGATYDHPYFVYADSSVSIKSKLVSTSKKIYSVQVPVYATYKIANNIHLKAGPVISFPLKQYNVATPVDSVSQYVLSHSRYDQKTDFGFAGGANYQYKRLIFEVNYLKGITQHSIVTDSLIHKATNNTFQFSIKLQLGGNKK
ncbi:MAG TPA: hypothetical protein VIM89_21895 [Mucilaginibacter sp.]